MPEEARLLAAFALALAAALATTPVAMAIATRTDFHDKPVGYKRHARPTPYLGGAAVLGGVLVAVLALSDKFGHIYPIVFCTCGLWALGTLDDRVGLPLWPRVVAEAAAAIALWATGNGWDVFASDGANLALTIFWIVGLVNAFNLMDNMDGAAATVASITGLAIGTLALIEGDVPLAVLTFGLAGACAGFLPYNLARPARIFLGDGGSLAIGFIIAAALMVMPAGVQGGLERLLAALLLAGVPVVDTGLVIVSRRRAGVPVLSGGRDHITHRLQTRRGTARRVALTLGLTQALLGAIAIGVFQIGRGSVVVAWWIWFLIAVVGIAMLETSAWAPVRASAAPDPPTGEAVQTGAGRGSGSRPSPAEALLIAFISIACGLSPFLYGFYEPSVWGPIGLGMTAAFIALCVARPAVPRRRALVAGGALAGLWVWALVSSGWAESADQAMTEANRWFLYAALFGVLVLLLRDDRLGAIVIGCATAVILGLGLYIVARMLAGSGAALFFNGRLHKPLGYANGQVGYLALGLWPLLAAAERARRPLAAGAALAGATFLAALVLLGQTRAVVPALVVSAVVLLVVVPGRTRRAWALLFVVAGVLASLGPILDVYHRLNAGGAPDSSVLRDAAVAILLSAALAGAAWVAGVLAVRIGARAAMPRRRLLARLPLAVIALGALLVVAANVHDPVGRVKREYRAFTQLDRQAGASSRFVTGGGNRYDYWRVAAKEFSSQPLRGVGAGNYPRTYFQDRRTTEDIRQPHSLELQALAELGLVGGALVLLFVGAVLSGLVGRVRQARRDARRSALTVAAGGVFLVWLVHTSVDWLHLIPGITGIALCAAAVLVAPWLRGAPRPGPRVRLAAVAAVSIVALAGAVLLGRAVLADRYRGQAATALREGRTSAALDRAGDSLRLNPESLQAHYLQSAAWARRGRYPEARAALGQALRREPHAFVSWALLGDLAVRRGDLALARRAYRRAALLNPRDAGLKRLAGDPKSALAAQP